MTSATPHITITLNGIGIGNAVLIIQQEFFLSPEKVVCPETWCDVLSIYLDIDREFVSLEHGVILDEEDVADIIKGPQDEFMTAAYGAELIKKIADAVRVIWMMKLPNAENVILYCHKLQTKNDVENKMTSNRHLLN